jgi:hypothetical protein
LAAQEKGKLAAMVELQAIEVRVPTAGRNNLTFDLRKRARQARRQSNVRTTTMSDFTNADEKAGACAYILHMLLQRLEVSAPGIVDELLSGAKADKAAFDARKTTSGNAGKIFGEAIAMLSLIEGQRSMISPHPSKDA